MRNQARAAVVLAECVHNPGREPYDVAASLMGYFWAALRSGSSGPAEQNLRTQGSHVADEAKVVLSYFAGYAPALPSLPSETDDDALRSLAILARAADEAITELADFALPPVTNGTGVPGCDVLVRHGFPTQIGERFRVVRRTPAWTRHVRTPGTAPFEDFILSNHAVFPEMLNGYRIVLHQLEDEEFIDQSLADANGSSLKAYLGAFDGERDWPKGPEGRYVGFAEEDGVPSTRFEEICGHLESAWAANAAIVVLPELTTTKTIDRQLAAMLLGSGAEGRRRLVVAGSYHVREGCKQRNQTVLRTSSGRKIFRQNKRIPFVVDGFVEDIRAAEELHILLTPRGPIIVAICRDFCDTTAHLDVLSTLPIKLALVPSMGAAKTERAHIARARGPAGRHEWRAVIAQQMATEVQGQQPSNVLLSLRAGQAEPTDHKHERARVHHVVDTA